MIAKFEFTDADVSTSKERTGYYFPRFGIVVPSEDEQGIGDALLNMNSDDEYWEVSIVPKGKFLAGRKEKEV